MKFIIYPNKSVLYTNCGLHIECESHTQTCSSDACFMVSSDSQCFTVFGNAGESENIYEEACSDFCWARACAALHFTPF